MSKIWYTDLMYDFLSIRSKYHCRYLLMLQTQTCCQPPKIDVFSFNKLVSDISVDQLHPIQLISYAYIAWVN